jgi:hypothetical protein
VTGLTHRLQIAAKKVRVEIKDVYLTTGAHDILLAEAPLEFGDVIAKRSSILMNTERGSKLRHVQSSIGPALMQKNMRACRQHG